MIEWDCVTAHGLIVFPKRLSEPNKMADNDIIIGRVINITGAIGVLSGIFLFFFGIVLLVFRRGLGFDIANSFYWFW